MFYFCWMRYALNVSYLGTNYHGWQKQPNAISVQEELENVFSTIFRRKIITMGSGRTDTGVHASEQVLHLDTNEIELNKNSIGKVNRLLPKDISINGFAEMKEDFHARFDAVKRSYIYKIATKKSPFNQGQAYRVNYPLDIDRMNEACQFLLGKHDFCSFSKVHTEVNNFMCEVLRAEWKEEKDEIHFHVSANRFLRGMVRALVGTLLEIGRGKKEPFWIKDVLSKKDRSAAGRNVPAEGLFLCEVQYEPSLNWIKVD